MRKRSMRRTSHRQSEYSQFKYNSLLTILSTIDNLIHAEERMPLKRKNPVTTEMVLQNQASKKNQVPSSSQFKVLKGHWPKH